MSRCPKNLSLYLQNELDDEERARIEFHLRSCSRCAEELRQLRLLSAKLRPPEVDEKALAAARRLTLMHLRRSTRPRFYAAEGPLYRAALAAVLIVMGFFLGRWSHGYLSPAGQESAASHREVRPYVVGVQDLDFDVASGTFVIEYNTINEIRLKGALEEAELEQLLHYAMLEDPSPRIRLHAVKALAAAARQHKKLSDDLIQSLHSVIRREQNTGVKLMAIRVLETLPMDRTIRAILTGILFRETNTAIRIEAFKALTRDALADAEAETYLHPAKQDSNSYIRYKAHELLQQITQSRSL